MSYGVLGRADSIHQLPMDTDASGLLAGMMDLSTVAPLTTPPPGRIAIHAHIFYTELAAEFAKFLENMPFPYDLFVSAPNEAASQTCRQAFSQLPQLEQLAVTIVPNRGRDIAPLFCTFGDTLQQYEYIAHFHSKKSLHNSGATDGWREYLLTNLLGSKLQIQKIFALLAGEKAVGLVYPQNFSEMPYMQQTPGSPIKALWHTSGATSSGSQKYRQAILIFRLDRCFGLAPRRCGRYSKRISRLRIFLKKQDKPTQPWRTA
jgi:hypothetical protein